MTPEFLLETLFKDLSQEGGRTPLADPPLQREPGARITRPEEPAQTVVAVVGLGSAGLPSAVALRRAGFRTVGIDGRASRLAEIRGGRAELSELHREELIADLLDEDFVLTERIEEAASADLVLICVPATPDPRGRPNVEPLRRTCAAVVEQARRGQTLVLASTGHVGSTRELLVMPLAERGLVAGEDVFVAFSAERGDAGVPMHEQLRSPRVVGAFSDRCMERASELLSPLCERLHAVSSLEAAEMAQLYESTFRAVNIALAYEIADACRSHELDPVEIIDAAATKPFGFLAHYPSAGVGGGSVAVDPHHLLAPLRERGRPSPIAEEAMRSIAARPHRVAKRANDLLRRSGQPLRDARVLVVGAAYKPGVSDCTHSPAVEIISRLRKEGAQVEYHDPLVPMLRVDGEELYGVDPDPRRDASGFGPEDYDLAILVTVQPACDYGWLKRCSQVLDCTYREHSGRRRFLP